MQEDYTKELIEKYTQNLQDLCKLSTDKLLVEVLETFFKLERKNFLKENNDRDNKGNGFYERMFQGLSSNGLKLAIPRTRINNFKPMLLELVKQDEEMVKDFALDLYISGLSSRDTEKVINKYFSKNLSHSSIVELSSEYQQAREAWERRKIDKYYKVVFVDAMWLPLRRGNTYTQEAILIILGLREDNRREILYFDIAPEESSSNYQEILKKLKRQGLKKIDLVVADGLNGLPEAINRIYPKTLFQLCTVHKKRNVLKKIRIKDKERVASDLNYVFALFKEKDDIKEGNRRLDEFINKWIRYYPRIRSHFPDKIRAHLFTYTKFNPEIRRYIYTTNNLENLNSILRKSFRNKYSFKSETNLLNYIFLVLMNIQEENLLKYEVNQFRYFNKLNTTQTQLG